MKILTLVLLLLLFVPVIAGAQSAVTNQRLTDTVPFIPEHRARRIAQFEKEPVEAGQIIFLGNSITEAGKWSELLGDNTVANRGIGGDITFGLMKRLDDVIRRKPAKLFIMIGINDIAKDIPDLVIADNYRKIIQEVQAKSPATKIYVQSVLPVNPDVPGFPQHYDKQEHVINVNRLLRVVAASTGTEFIDLFPLFVDSRNRLDAKYTGDGLHLNAEAYQVWVDHLRTMGYL